MTSEERQQELANIRHYCETYPDSSDVKKIEFVLLELAKSTRKAERRIRELERENTDLLDENIKLTAKLRTIRELK